MPGMRFLAYYPAGQRGHFTMVDRDTGEVLGTVWRASRGTWSAAGPDGVPLIVGRGGSRDATGALLYLLLTE